MSESISESMPVKDRVAAEFEKVKSEERTRAERVQGIVREAFSQAVAEVKEGSGEIRAIAQDAFSVSVEGLKQKGQTIKQDLTTSFDAGAEETKLNEQLTLLGKKLAEWDNKLTGRFNERLAEARLTLTEKAKAWYDSLSQEDQAKLENKFVVAKATWLEKQQQLRQRIREVLQSAASKL